VKSVPLGQLTRKITSGSTPLGGSATYLGAGPVMLVRSQNVHMNRLDLSDVAYISDETDGGMNRSRLEFDDVLLNITGASIGRVARFDLHTRANVNQHVCIIRPKPDLLCSRYLTYLISSPSFQRNIDRLQHGGTRQALTYELIRDFDIPLLPLPEQKRIAAILDKADAIRRSRQEAVLLTDQLIPSLFYNIFGSPTVNPRRWGRRPLGEITLIDAPMVDPRLDEYAGLPHYGADRIDRDTGRLLPAKTAHEDGLISAKFLLDERYVLYSKIRPNLRKVALGERKALCSADV